MKPKFSKRTKMEKKLNNKENQLQELLEHKDFNTLSGSEATLVLGIISETEYALRRQIIISSLKDEGASVSPLPLMLPTKKSEIMVMPVYQAMLAVAATIVVMWFLKFPFEKEEVSSTAAEVKYVAQIDTVFLDKIRYDTIYEVIEKATIIEKKVYKVKTVVEYVNSPELIASNKILEAPSYDVVPNLAKVSSEIDGGSSMSDDNTLGLIPEMILRD
jgi:hypothetical protein